MPWRPKWSDPDNPPSLEFGQWAGLHDFDHVADVRSIGLVVGVADCAPPEHLAVLGMGHEPFD